MDCPWPEGSLRYPRTPPWPHREIRPPETDCPWRWGSSRYLPTPPWRHHETHLLEKDCLWQWVACCHPPASQHRQGEERPPAWAQADPRAWALAFSAAAAHLEPAVFAVESGQNRPVRTRANLQPKRR